MSTERIVKIVILDLSNDILRYEADLEATINSDLEAKEKSHKIRTLLSQIVLAETSLSKFNAMVSNGQQTPPVTTPQNQQNEG